MKINTNLICDIGSVRQNNEDMILLNGDLYRDNSMENIYELSDNARFMAIVADGMGGENGGEIASEVILTSFNEFVYSMPINLGEEDIISQIKNWVQIANNQILSIGYQNSNLRGMGSTFCGIIFYEKLIFSLNIGDSRLYRFRDGVLKQLTTDHSIRKLTGDKSIGNNIIYNSFGSSDGIFIDIKNITQQIFDNDIFIICSDGLTDMLSDDEIEIIISQTPTSKALTERAKKSGGKDNISTIVLRIVNTLYKPSEM